MISTARLISSASRAERGWSTVVLEEVVVTVGRVAIRVRSS